MKHKLIYLLISTIPLFISCKSSKDASCDAYGNYYNYPVDTTICWGDSRVSFIDISYPNGLEIPKIPVNQTNQLHMNDLTSGVYTITFKSDTEILFKKIIKIN
jgi:hypothetical protein